MKKIEQIRTNYDIITEKKDADDRKLDALARSGLFESKKLPVLKRALEKEPEKMTIAERKVVLELLDSLISETVNQQSINEANQGGQYLTKYDPRFGNTAAVSERDLPTIIILKRKGIRVFGSNQKIGLYYSQYLDRYISIPFGSGVPVVNEAVDWEKAFTNYKKDYKDIESDADTDISSFSKSKKKDGAPATDDERNARLKKFVIQKAREGKIRSKHYSVLSGGGPENKELKKASIRPLTHSLAKGDINALDYAGIRAGLAARSAISNAAKGIRSLIKSKKAAAPATTTSAQPTPAPAETPAPSAAETKPVSAPRTLSKKQQAVKADVSARMASAKKSGQKARDPNVPEASRKMAANRARRFATYAQMDKKKAGLMEKIREVRNRKIEEGSVSDFTYKDLHDDSWTALGKDFIPGVGTARAAERTKQSLAKGDYGTAALHGLDTAVSGASDAALAVPVLGTAVGGALKGGQAIVKGGIKLGSKLLGKAAEKGAVETGAKVAEKGAAEAGAKVLEPAAAKVAEKGAVEAGEKAAASTAAKAATKSTARKGLGKLATRAALGALGGSSTSDSGKKELSPAKFGLNIKVNKPESSVSTGVDKRQSNMYRKSFEASTIKEARSNTSSSVSSTLTPAPDSGLKIKISAPKSKYRTGVDARMQAAERRYWSTPQNEDVLKSLKNMVSEGISEMQLNIAESPVTINNTIAQKIVSVHESLNKDNKKHLENMLGESVDSFKKIVNFAVRQ